MSKKDQNLALNHELKAALGFVDDTPQDIARAAIEFSKNPCRENAYKVSDLLRLWTKNEEKYHLLRKIKQHGWGQEDTNHE